MSVIKELEDLMKDAIFASKNLVRLTNSDNFMCTNQENNQILNKQLLKQITTLFKINGVECKIPYYRKTLESTINYDEFFDLISEANDNLLGKIDVNLDECLGYKRKQTPFIPERLKAQNLKVKRHNLINSDQNDKISVLAAKNVSKPQVSWAGIDNSDEPFKTKLKIKHNAIIPFCPNGHEIIKDEYQLNDKMINLINLNPYFYEITNLTIPSSLYEIDNSIKITESDSTPLKIIETVENLDSLINDLLNVDVIAIDIENHSYRSYMGFSCLVQISTKTTDYIVDCIKLRDEMYKLNDTFTNPRIIKIFHGADMDIQWLQRDFGIYVVNMFDTGRASRSLALPKFSLSYLLEKYCNVFPDKSFQLADWRIRPLTEEMLKYAREDTHYLIYIFEQMKKDLLNKHDGKYLIENVFKNSKSICLQVFEKPNNGGSLKISSKTSLPSENLSYLDKLCKWRLQLAKLEDESLMYILPNHMIIELCNRLPKNLQGVLECCKPTPILVRQNIHQIVSILNESNGLENTKFSDENKNKNSLKTQQTPDSIELLKHDIKLELGTSVPASQVVYHLEVYGPFINTFPSSYSDFYKNYESSVEKSKNIFDISSHFNDPFIKLFKDFKLEEYEQQDVNTSFVAIQPTDIEFQKDIDQLISCQRTQSDIIKTKNKIKSKFKIKKMSGKTQITNANVKNQMKSINSTKTKSNIQELCNQSDRTAVDDFDYSKFSIDDYAGTNNEQNATSSKPKRNQKSVKYINQKKPLDKNKNKLSKIAKDTILDKKLSLMQTVFNFVNKKL